MNFTPRFNLLKKRGDNINPKIVNEKNISCTCSLMESNSKSKHLREIKE